MIFPERDDAGLKQVAGDLQLNLLGNRVVLGGLHPLLNELNAALRLVLAHAGVGLCEHVAGAGVQQGVVQAGAGFGCVVLDLQPPEEGVPVGVAALPGVGGEEHVRPAEDVVERGAGDADLLPPAGQEEVVERQLGGEDPAVLLNGTERPGRVARQRRAEGFPVLQHRREGVVEQGQALPVRLLLHGRPLDAGVGIKAGGKEQAAAVERRIPVRGVEAAGDLVGKRDPRVAGHAVGEGVAHQVGVEGKGQPLKGADKVVELHVEGRQVVRVLAFENGAADFPGADKIPLFVFHHVLVQVGREGDIAGERNAFIEPHMFRELRDVDGVVLIADDRFRAEMPVRGPVTPGFKRQNRQAKEVDILFRHAFQFDNGGNNQKQQPVEAGVDCRQGDGGEGGRAGPPTAPPVGSAPC